MKKVDKVAYDLSKQIDAKLDRLQTKVHSLQDKNTELEQHIKQLQGQLGSFSLKEPEMIKILAECVDAAKREIDRRKLQQALEAPHTKKLAPLKVKGVKSFEEF